MTRRLLVGLTGGLASGKSTVASLLAEAGCRVVDADRLVAELYRPGQPGVEAVRELFGPEVLTAEGAVDHPRVARRVFADPQARKRLEEAIHPLVRRRFRDLAEKQGGILVLEATLLVEAGYAPDFDLVVTVEAPREARIARAVARGLSPEDAQARLDAQGDGAARRAAAHRVIDNDGSLEDLRLKVAELVAELRERRPLPPFILVTGNRGKLEETRRLLGRKVENAAVDLPEIQSLDLVEVLEAKATEAFRRLGKPLVVEETGLALAAMGGFPGPLVKWMLEAMGPEGIARTAAALGDSRAVAHCALLWTDGKTTVLGRGETTGTLALPPRGTHGFGWDPVFQPDGHDLTYAELGDEIKDAIGHRGRAWRDLIGRLGAR